MQTERIQTYALVGLLGAVAVLAFFIFKPFLTPLALAAIFAVVLYPLQRFFLKRLKGWSGLAAAVTILVVTVCLLVPLSAIALRIIGEAQHTYVSLTQGSGLANTQGAVLYIGESLEPSAPGSYAFAQRIASDLNQYVENGLRWLLGHTGAAFSSLLNVALDLFIFFIALFAFLKNGPAIRAQLLHLSPFNDDDDDRIFNRLALTINTVVRGSLAVSLIQGVVASVGYVIFGVPNPLLWGLITCIAALVPGVGTALVIAPAIGFLLIAGDTVSALGLLAWGIAAVGLIDNFVGPMLMSRGIHLPSLVILLSVLGGLAFFGPAGLFLGPLTVSLLLALFSLYADAQKRRTG
ncbi:MAG TPA: AI-2E family transporter [Candidatus Paceibacterota bacterium]|jgi:predicted PurR-regulated permease PerM